MVGEPQARVVGVAQQEKAERHGVETGVYFTSNKKTLNDSTQLGDIPLTALIDWREITLET